MSESLMSESLLSPAYDTIRLTSEPQIYHCEPNWRWRPPPLADHDFWCILAGQGQVHFAGHSLNLEPGTCCLFPPLAEPYATQDAAQRLVVFYAHFDPLNAQGEVTLLAPPVPALLLSDLEFIRTLAARCEQCFQRGDALGLRQSRLLVDQMLMCYWEEALCPRLDPADQLIREIIAEIRRQPGADWSVAEQAQRAFLSGSQYTRRFREITGLTPIQFVVQTRLERAHRLLLETDMTLAQIADALGYRDVGFFGRQFKRHTGCSPGTFRCLPTYLSK